MIASVSSWLMHALQDGKAGLHARALTYGLVDGFCFLEMLVLS